MIIGVARASILMAKADQIYEKLSYILERLIQELDTPALDPDEAYTELSRTFKQLTELVPNDPYPVPLPLKVYDLTKALITQPDNDKMTSIIAEAMKDTHETHLKALKLCASMIAHSGGEIGWK